MFLCILIRCASRLVSGRYGQSFHSYQPVTARHGGLSLYRCVNTYWAQSVLSTFYSPDLTLRTRFRSLTSKTSLSLIVAVLLTALSRFFCYNSFEICLYVGYYNYAVVSLHCLLLSYSFSSASGKLCSIIATLYLTMCFETRVTCRQKFITNPRKDGQRRAQ